MITIHYEYDVTMLEKFGVPQIEYEADLTAAFLNQWAGATIEIAQGSSTWVTSTDMMICPADVITIADNVLGSLCDE